MSVDLPALYSAIVLSSDDAIVSKDLNSIVTSWNPAAERMFGFSAVEMVGKSIRLIIPDDRQGEEDIVLEHIRSGRSVEHFETIRRRKDGGLLFVSLSVSPVRNVAGKIVGASKIARDITDRKLAERAAARLQRQTAFLARLSAALSAARDHEETLQTIVEVAVPEIVDWCAVDIVQADGHLQRLAMAHANSAKIPMTEMVHRRYTDVDSPTSAHTAIRSGHPAFIARVTDDIIVAAANGDQERISAVRQLGLVSYICIPLISRGRTCGALTLATADSGRQLDEDDLRFSQDIAARTALAIDNAVAFEQLTAANRLKDEFLATLSHELRTPLNAILGYTRMIRAGILAKEKLGGALEIVERNATSLTQIVEDVLDVSRIASGKIRLNMQPLQPAMVITDAVATVRPAADAKSIRLELEINPSAGLLSGDPDRLRQVLWNMLSNAVKFTPTGGRVRICVDRLEGYVEIAVSDTGIGVSEEFLPHIFERFRQADGGTTRAHGGLGLGLAIAHQIVELHGGTIHAESGGYGQGATFRVRLPAMSGPPAVVPEERRVTPRVERRDVTAGMPDLHGIRVLAVDDDPDALSLIREILEVAGADVLTARDAPTALRILQHDAPDVLISDIAMPTMDGFALIERIRHLDNERHRTTPAAAVTAYARSEDRVRSLRSGFEMHLAKPIDPAELGDAVASLAQRRRRD